MKKHTVYEIFLNSKGKLLGVLKIEIEFIGYFEAQTSYSRRQYKSIIVNSRLLFAKTPLMVDIYIRR